MGKARSFSNESNDTVYQTESNNENYTLGSQQNSYNLGSVHFSDQSGIGNFSQSAQNSKFVNLKGSVIQGNIGFVQQTVELNVGTDTIDLNNDAAGVVLAVISQDRIVTLSAGSTSDLTTITGAQRQGQRVTLYNIFGNTITIKNDAGSTVNTIVTPGAVDFTLSGHGLVTLIFDISLAQWRVEGNLGSGGGEFFGPWTADHDAGDFALNNVSSIQISDTASNVHGLLQGIVAEGIRLTLTAGEQFSLIDNITTLITINTAGGVVINNLDITMGTGNIIAGGAGEGLTNTGHIDFIDNMATPGAAISLYSDGTDLFANTGGGVVNFSNVLTSLTPWTVNIDAAGFSLNNLLAIDIEDSVGATKLGISGPLGVGARFSFVAGDTVFFTENITDIISITAAGLNLLTNDITMGVAGNIVAGGAGEGMTNIGHLDFIDNMATPIATFSIFSDGTDLFANTGSSTKNLDEMVTTSIANTFTAIQTFDLNIVAGGAGDGMTNIGHLDFIDNMATPAAALSIYSDGTDILVNTGGGVVNISDIGDGVFLDSGFRIQGSGDPTKQLAFEVDGFTTATTNTFTMPNTSGTVFLALAFQDLDMNASSIIGAGAGEGMSNIGNLTFVDNLATPGATFAIFSDGTDLFANTGSVTKNLDLMMSNPSVEGLDMGGFAITNGQMDTGFLNTGILGVSRGGTSNGAYTQGDMLYSPSANVLSRLPIGANGAFLMSDGTDVAWDTTPVMQAIFDMNGNDLILDADGDSRFDLGVDDEITIFLGSAVTENYKFTTTSLELLAGNYLDMSDVGTPALAGAVRFGNNQIGLGWLNNAGTDSVLLTVNTSDELDFVFDSVVQATLSATELDLTGSDIIEGGTIKLIEQAAANPDLAGRGQIWVRTATPNELFFTDDAGTDFQLGAGGGAASLNDLTDVTIAAIADTDLLIYDSGSAVFENHALSGDITITNTGVASLAANSVDSVEIIANAVNTAEMAHQNDGAIITYSTATTPIILDPGAEGEVLTAHGAGAVLTYEVPASPGTQEASIVTSHETDQFDFETYHANTMQGATSTPFNITEDVQYYVPFFLSTTVDADRMGVDVTSVTGNYRLSFGIYAARTDGQNYPAGSILVQATTLFSGTGAKSINITNTELSPGLYFLSMSCTDNTTVTLRSTQAAEGNVCGYEDQGASGFLPLLAYVEPNTSSTLVTTPDDEMVTLNAFAPLVLVKFAPA